MVHGVRESRTTISNLPWTLPWSEIQEVRKREKLSDHLKFRVGVNTLSKRDPRRTRARMLRLSPLYMPHLSSLHPTILIDPTLALLLNTKVKSPLLRSGFKVQVQGQYR